MTDIIVDGQNVVIVETPSPPAVVVATEGSGGLTNVVALTQAQYDALTPDPTTLYVIIE